MNRIHKASHLDDDVEIGSGNVIEAGAVIRGPIRIGDDNYFGPNCVVGTPAQDDLTRNELFSSAVTSNAREPGVIIGDRNIFREFVTVHRGQMGPTVVEDDNYFMAYSHIAHDCRIASSVKIANSVQMGGYATIERGSYIGLSAVLHQFTVIGAHCMIGMGSVVTIDGVPPGSLIHGVPARLRGPNVRALDALGVSGTDWWPVGVTDENESEIPHRLREDVVQFRAHLARAAGLRTEVDGFRAAIRPSSPSDEGFDG